MGRAIRESHDIDELNHDRRQGKYKPFSEQLQSIFSDTVEDLPLEMPRRGGKWNGKPGGFQVSQEND